MQINSHLVEKSATGWTIFGLLVLLVSCPCSVKAQQPAPGTKWQLTKVDFVGLQAQKPDELIVASGLQIGQTIDVGAIRAASQKLSDTGLFKKVSARYQYTGETIEVTFTIEEAKAEKVACVFDNFIWFSDQEIHDAIKRDWLEFDGTASSDYAINQLKRSLTSLLREHQISGEIAYERTEDAGGRSAHIFTVKAPNLKVCAVQYAGLQANLKRELDAALQQHLNAAYSRTESNIFMRVALLPVFQQHGYLKARFATVQARPAANGECKEAGVLLTLPITEGLQYRWEQALWSGNQAFSTKELEALLVIKAGDIANSDKIAESFARVQGIFGTKGYLAAALMPQPVFDEAQQRVSYQVLVTEGPQYRMGQLILTGVPENEAKRLQSKWKLKPGEIFNTALVGEFIYGLRQESGIKDLERKYNLDKEKLTADVEIQIKK